MTDLVTHPPVGQEHTPLPEHDLHGDHLRDAPDEWGRQSFPASDPPQNW